MYNLDKESTLIPRTMEIIDLEEHKRSNDYAEFNRMDIDFRVPVSYGKVIVNTGLDLKEKATTDSMLNKIAVEFSRLETEQQILDFAKKYGLLGLGKAAQNIGCLNDRREIHLYIQGFRYEETHVEPLTLWRWHIGHVKKLLQLARGLSKEHRGMDIEIEENLLYVDEPLFPKHMVSDLNRGEFYYQWVYWYDHEYTTVDIVRSDYSFNKAARLVLVNSITAMLNGAINKEPDGFIEDKTSKYGFKIQEKQSTNFLLAAIYHDIWDMIAKDESIKTCEYAKCRKAFHAVGRKKYCCDSCRVKDFNLRSVSNIG